MKSEDFFAGDKYPQIKFEGKKFEKTGDEYRLTGELTIRDITKTLAVNVEFGGLVKDPWGNTRAGFHIDGKINRKEFDLRVLIETFAKEKNIQAGFILSSIGSLNGYHLRFANRQQGSSASGYFEIISLNGTISTNGVHLHIGLADSNGKVIGGHLLAGNHIYTTAEILIGESTQHIFTRAMDTNTGYNELEISSR